MTEKTLGTEAVVRDLVDEHGPPPCVVRHPDAGGQCERTATMEVYGLPFCEVHGTEAKAGALEELYYDAANFLHTLDTPHVTPPNPVASRALRETLSRLGDEERRASRGDHEAALIKAYPLVPEQMDEDARDFDYRDPEPRESPVDWNYASRMLIHKLMRIAYEAGSDHYLVEILEEQREYVSAQLAFALADYDERVRPTHA